MRKTPELEIVKVVSVRINAVVILIFILTVAV